MVGLRVLPAPVGALLLVAPAPAYAVAPCAGTYSVDPAVARASDDGDAPAAPAPAKTKATLKLTLQGRFEYTLTRGEHEETAQGRWSATEDRVILSGDPVTAPAFLLEGDIALDEPALRIDLDLPNGLSRQYFTVAVRLADGTVVGRAFTEAAFELATSAHNPPVALRIDVPTLALSSPDFALGPGTGHRLHVRFAANDLGKVAFADTPLVERDGALMLPRPDGDLAFRREGRCSAE